MTTFIHIANVLYLVSYLVRDILWLRWLTVIAICTLMPYFYFQAEPLWASQLRMPVSIDKDLTQPDSPDDEYIYWSN